MNTQTGVNSAGAIPGKPYRGINGSARCTVLGVGPFDPECLERSVVIHSASGGFRCWPEDEFLKAFALST